jgi:hypothetical protein
MRGKVARKLVLLLSGILVFWHTYFWETITHLKTLPFLSRLIERSRVGGEKSQREAFYGEYTLLGANALSRIPDFWLNGFLVFWLRTIGRRITYYRETNYVLSGDELRTIGRRITYYRETNYVLSGDEFFVENRPNPSQKHVFLAFKNLHNY